MKYRETVGIMSRIRHTVAELCLTLLYPWTIDLQAPQSMGRKLARKLGWVTISVSRVSSQPRDQTHVSCSAGQFFTTEAPEKPPRPLKVKVKVTQSSPNLCDPMDYTVHGILQARILEWVAFPFSRASSQPRDRTQVSCIVGRFLTS